MFIATCIALLATGGLWLWGYVSLKRERTITRWLAVLTVIGLCVCYVLEYIQGWFN